MTKTMTITRTLLALLFLFLAAPIDADAQILKRAKKAAKRGVERSVEREVEHRADRITTGAIDAVSDAVVCAVTDKTCIREASAEGRDVVVVDAEGEALPADEQATVIAEASADPSTGDEEAATSTLRPGEGVWANYDFVPGDRPLFIEDFEDAFVGDVPRRIGFVSGTMETVEWQSGQLLRFTSDSGFTLDLPEELPERFTIEFDLHMPHFWHSFCFATGPLTNAEQPFSCFHGQARNYDGAFFNVSEMFETGLRGGNGGTAVSRQTKAKEGLTTIRIMADGSYVKMYLDDTRIVNVPNADLQRSDQIHVHVAGEVDHERPAYVDNIRIAAGGREIIHERLMAEGRFATQGIFFDTGSATLKPESTPTLNDIGRTLERYADLRLRIEGHTDNTGSDDTNLRLSQERAEAVLQYLVEAHGIDPGRLEAEGIGSAQPIAGNDTPEGRQQNRRVELVRL